MISVIPDTERRYLREIYDLEINGVLIVGPKDIADRLNVTRATAYEYLVKLTNKGFLQHIPRKGFRLSDRGRCIAKRLIRNHRIIETFLVKFLDLEVDDACELASKIENNVPVTVVEKIYENVGCPACCPHGKPIPELKDCDEAR